MKKQLMLAMGLIFVTAVSALATFSAAGMGAGIAPELYNIAVDQIIQGPIGFVCGLMAMAFGAIAAIRAQIMLAIPAILGGAAILKADSIVNSMGSLI